MQRRQIGALVTTAVYLMALAGVKADMDWGKRSGHWGGFGMSDADWGWKKRSAPDSYYGAMSDSDWGSYGKRNGRDNSRYFGMADADWGWRKRSDPDVDLIDVDDSEDSLASSDPLVDVDKRHVGSLMGVDKRHVGALARSNFFPYKRYTYRPRNPMIPGRRWGGKRNMAALARNNYLPDKRNMAALARNNFLQPHLGSDELTGADDGDGEASAGGPETMAEDKRHVGSLHGYKGF
jgi:hypothetical protein